MDRTQQFLTRFNELEQFLRETTDSKREVPFGSLIGRAANKNATVRRHERDLREFADLRNAIVHEHPRGHVIADITREALDEFTGIVEHVTAPERVYPLFRSEITVYREDDPLTDAVKDLWQTGHNQIIVRVEAMLTLLSTAGVSRWLGRQVDGSCVDLSDATIADALAYEEAGGIAFVDRDAPVDEARELFLSFPHRRQQRLRAVVVTEHGRPREAPLGIITASDLVELDE
ncbi:MAG: CBS domain-containing protein [Thermomicrobiales bacterium]|nr:CBS domain-containing protein [Thermomicrobiales bacterium]